MPALITVLVFVSVYAILRTTRVGAAPDAHAIYRNHP